MKIDGNKAYMVALLAFAMAMFALHQGHKELATQLTAFAMGLATIRSALKKIENGNGKGESTDAQAG